MSVARSAWGWFGLYLALGLAPLAAASLAGPPGPPRPFAVELAVAFGFLAFALLALEFALVARLGAASAPFGTDALMLFHRQIGLLALAFALAHPLLLVARGLAPAALNPFAGTPASRWGAVASWSALLLVVLAVGRRRLPWRHETWHWLHGALALLVAGSMLAHALLVDRYARAPLVRGVLLGYVAALLALGLRYRLVRPLLLARRPWEIVENRDEGADVRTLVLRPVGHAGLRFAPGQFCWLVTGRSPLTGQQHPLSISSSAADGSRLEFSIKALGDWSRGTVPSLRPGTRVWVDGPFGAFTPDRQPASALVLVAGGIGIAPMRSVLLTLRDRGDRRPVLLVHAARNRGRTVFGPELAALERALDLRVVHVFEEGEPGGRAETGYVTEELLRRLLPPRKADLSVLLCGPGAMLDALEGALPRLGVPAGRIHTERFDLV